jgi:4-coumarate--CoA ligase
VFVTQNVAKKTADVCKNIKTVRNVVLIEGQSIDNFIVSANGLIKKHGKSNFDVEDQVCHEVDIHNQIAMLFCSSGTTGLPKGVQTTQENMMSCLQTHRGSLQYVKDTRKHQIIALNIAPWSHVLGFVFMFMFACSRDTVLVFMPKFEEASFYKNIEVSLKQKTENNPKVE